MGATVLRKNHHRSINPTAISQEGCFVRATSLKVLETWNPSSDIREAYLDFLEKWHGTDWEVKGKEKLFETIVLAKHTMPERGLVILVQRSNPEGATILLISDDVMTELDDTLRKRVQWITKSVDNRRCQQRYHWVPKGNEIFLELRPGMDPDPGPIRACEDAGAQGHSRFPTMSVKHHTRPTVH